MPFDLITKMIVQWLPFRIRRLFGLTIIGGIFLCFLLCDSISAQGIATTTLPTTTTTTPTTTTTTPTATTFLTPNNTVTIRSAVILTHDTGALFDAQILKPAITVAFDRARYEYGVIFQNTDYIYEASATSNSPDPALRRSQGCWMWNASGSSIQAINATTEVVFGPACTQDMQIVEDMLTFFRVPSVTGAANLVDSTAEFDLLTRTGYSTFDLWTFIIQMFMQNQWSNIGILYDNDNLQLNVLATSLESRLKSFNLKPFTVSFNGTMFDDFDSIPTKLAEVTANARIIVMILQPALLRYFLVYAKRQGLTNGEYVYFATDFFLDSLLTPTGSWKQRDGYDHDALVAFFYLFVLSLKDTRDTPEYQLFQSQMISEGASTLNYYQTTFYDGILMFSRAVREDVDNNSDGNSTWDAKTVIQQGMWNSTMQGASGLVYINPLGDRNHDLELYYMTDTEAGTFSVVADYFGLEGQYRPRDGRDIVWRTSDGRPPPNEPFCGYANDKCFDTKTTGVIAGVLGTIFLLGGSMAFIICYAKTKRSRVLAQREWIADWDELNADAPATSSRMSMNSFQSGTTQSKSSVATRSTGSVMHKKRPPPSSGRIFFVNWRGRSVMCRKCERRQFPIHLNQQVLSEIKLVRNMIHDNLWRFMGTTLGPENVVVIGEYCSKGSLQDILVDETQKLDWIFRFSLLNDIVKGVIYIQSTSLGCHGRLSSRGCYVDGKFVLKVGDYGLPTFYAKMMPEEMTNADYADLFWTAPELLDDPYGAGTTEGDSFSYAIILQEVILRDEPYSMYDYEAQDIINRVRNAEIFFRPNVSNPDCPLGLIALMDLCWQHDPLERPRFPQIKTSIRQATKGAIEKHNLVDLLISQMEQYTAELEKIVDDKTRELQDEQRKADALLNQILPKFVAEKLKLGEVVPPEAFDSATIFFSDIVGFAALTIESTAIQIVDFLNDLYSLFDKTLPRFDVYKVETIHDSYMVASGLPHRNGLEHAKEQARLSLTLMMLIGTFRIRHRPLEVARLRVGLNSGPVVASVIGLAVPRYCLFGDTVNTASRMESTGEGLRIQVSPSCKELLDNFGMFDLVERGEIEVKGKGLIRTYWLIGEKTGFIEKQAQELQRA